MDQGWQRLFDLASCLLRGHLDAEDAGGAALATDREEDLPKARVGREVQIEPSQGSQLGLGRHCPSDQGDQLRFAYGFGRCAGCISLHNHLDCGGRSPLR